MGRIGAVLIAGAALFAGMVVQGDVDLGIGDDDVAVHRSERADRVDRRIDRAVDRATSRIERDAGRAIADANDPVTEQAMAAAVAELVRAEASLVTAKLDSNMPPAAIRQAEQRRDLAKEAFERLADDARAQGRANRDSNRQQVRDEIREGIRDAVRS